MPRRWLTVDHGMRCHVIPTPPAPPAHVRFALGIMGVEVIFLGDSLPKACQLDANGHVSTVALSAMALMFGLFTCGMACDQYQAATTNQTKIDRCDRWRQERNKVSFAIFLALRTPL